MTTMTTTGTKPTTTTRITTEVATTTTVAITTKTTTTAVTIATATTCNNFNSTKDNSGSRSSHRINVIRKYNRTNSTNHYITTTPKLMIPLKLI